jgi:hypothetical protein
MTPAFTKASADQLRSKIESSLGEQLSSALLLRERAAPLTVPFGIAALDQLAGGLPRGALSEITGPASSGRTGVMLSALAGATRRQEICALVDAGDSFDPSSAFTAGVDLERLLWVRCGPESPSLTRSNAARRAYRGAGPARAGFAYGGVLEQVLKVTDLLLQASGFGMVVLDLGDIPAESARRVPLTSWFRFRRAVEPTVTVLLLIEMEPCARSCASLVLQMRAEAVCAADSNWATAQAAGPELRAADSKLVARGLRNCPEDHACPRIPPKPAVSHAAVLQGLRLHAEVTRSWAQRRPPQSLGAHFELRTAV